LTVLDKLRDIINPEVIVNIATEDKTVVVKEKDTNSKIKKLIITDLPKDTFAFTLDYQPGGTKNKKFKQLSNYVNAECDYGVNKSCDLVIVSKPDNKCSYNVLVFDLKSTKPIKNNTKKQLLNSELFVKYLMTLLTNHCNVNSTISNYYRAIVISDKRANRKNKTYPKPSKSTKLNEDFKIVNVQVNNNKFGSVNFNKLQS